MGDVSDIEDLIPKAVRDVHGKRMRVLWSLGTAIGTVVCTTATVSWQLSAYVADLKHANARLREDILVMDKKIEALETAHGALEKEARDTRERADRALLLAQLAHGVKP